MPQTCTRITAITVTWDGIIVLLLVLEPNHDYLPCQRVGYYASEVLQKTLKRR